MMEIVNVRIDDRLIHGQVATVWSQVTRATRIMVVDDAVVKDPVNKEALKMACPSQCKLSILTVEKAAANLCAGKYEVSESLSLLRTLRRSVESMRKGSIWRQSMWEIWAENRIPVC